MATTSDKPLVKVNGVKYRWPTKPVAVVCIDGGDPAYLQQFLKDDQIFDFAINGTPQ